MTDRSFETENRAATADLRTLVESLSDAELAVDLGDGWNVSMALAHLAFWDEWHLARWVHAAGSGELAPPAVAGGWRGIAGLVGGGALMLGLSALLNV